MSGIFVVSPHPDDDAIGCGGAIARCVESGARVSVAYVTDGAASHPGSKRFPPESVRAIREAEAVSALRLLGVAGDPIFFRLPDGRLGDLDREQKEWAVASLETALRASACDFVFAPWPREPHPDHAASASFVREALLRFTEPPGLLWYAVWLDVFGRSADRPHPGVPNLTIHLSLDERARKRSAIMAHVSQTTRLIDDDPNGFCATADVLEQWLQPVERYYAATADVIRRFSDVVHVETTLE
jgi:LmbE family N-acetylglucosaminyl deacetylase